MLKKFRSSVCLMKALCIICGGSVIALTVGCGREPGPTASRSLEKEGGKTQKVLIEKAKPQDALPKEERQEAYLVEKASPEQTLKTIKKLMRTRAYKKAEKRFLEKGFKPIITKGTQCIATSTKGTEGLAQMYTFSDSITGEFIANALTIPYADTGNRIGILVACEDTEEVKTAPFYLTLEQPEDTTDALLIDEGEYVGYWIVYSESSGKVNWGALSCLAGFIFAVAVPPAWVVTAGLIVDCVIGFLGDYYG